jgi:hypothetical protein
VRIDSDKGGAWSHRPASRTRGRRPRIGGDTMGTVNRLIRRLTAQLGWGHEPSDTMLGLPCFACGEPATGWAFDADERGGRQVIDGFAACAAHQTRSERLPDEKAG